VNSRLQALISAAHKATREAAHQCQERCVYEPLKEAEKLIISALCSQSVIDDNAAILRAEKGGSNV
jgi:hypothetical protein